MDIECFYWAANSFCRLFRDHTETNDAFLEAWEEYTGVSEDGYCCPDRVSASQVTVTRKRPTVEKGPDAKRKEMDTIDANIEQKKYGITAFSHTFIEKQENHLHFP